MAGGSNRVAATFFVTISFILQIGSIVSPGWVIDIQQNVESYNNLFYTLTCKNKITTDCHAKAYNTIYKDKKAFLDWKKAKKDVYIQHDKDMHEDILEMTLVMVVLLCTFIVFVAHMIRTCNSEKNYKRLITISPTILALADGLMISVIFRKVIYNYYLHQIRDLDDLLDHTYVGFPYSLAMYGAALLANVMCAYLNTSHMTGLLKKPKKKKTSEDFDALVPAEKKPPVTKTYDVKETTVPVISDNSFDNPTFSVKL